MHSRFGWFAISAGLCLTMTQSCVESAAEGLCPAESADCTDVNGASPTGSEGDVCAAEDSCTSDEPCVARCVDGQPIGCDEHGVERIGPACEVGTVCDEGRCAPVPDWGDGGLGEDALSIDTLERAWDTSEDTPGPSPDGQGPSTLHPAIVIERAVLVSDSNHDGLVSPAESGVLALYLSNQGELAAHGVWVKLTELDPSLTVTSCDNGLSECDAACSCHGLAGATSLVPGETALLPSLQMAFTVDPAAELTPLTAQFDLIDEAGNTWSDSVTVEVSAFGAQLTVEDATLTQDSNGDGALSPGESAQLHLTARNAGTSPTGGIYMSLVSGSPFVEFTSCEVQGGSEWLLCDAQCNCEGISEDAKVDLAVDEVTDDVLLRIDFELADSAPIAPVTWHVALHDALGHVWEESVAIEVQMNGPSLSLSAAELVDDTNGDGVLSPGEGASLRLFAHNAGTETAKDIWAKLLTLDPGVSLTGCYVEEGSGWTACSEECNCESVAPAALQDLSPGEAGDHAILRVDFELPQEGAPSSLTFGVVLTDTHDTTWTDAVTLTVQTP